MIGREPVFMRQEVMHFVGENNLLKLHALVP